MFLFAEAARSSHQLAGNHMPPSIGPIRSGGGAGSGKVGSLMEQEVKDRREGYARFSKRFRKVDYPTSSSLCDKNLWLTQQQWRVSMNLGQLPQRAAQQKACKLRMCSAQRHGPISRFVNSQT